MFLRKRLKIIKGKVIQGLSEHPLSGIKVNLFSVNEIEAKETEEELIKSYNKKLVLSSKTDEKGEFLFILRDGTYSVNIDLESLPEGKSLLRSARLFRIRDSGYVTFRVIEKKPIIESRSFSSKNLSNHLSSIDKILHSSRLEEIDEHTKIKNLINVLFDLRDPEDSFKSKIPVKSGTTAVEEILKYIDSNDADPSVVHIAKSLVSSRTPSLERSYISPSGYFNIHYTLSGKNAVSAETGNTKSIPAYIKEIGLAFDKARQITCKVRGFQEPIIDQGKDSYDVYVVDLKGKYGITFPKNYYSGKAGSRTASSYICIDNSYSKRKGFTKSREDCMRVTAAHEFFHAVQYSYNYHADSWWKEASATWNEDEVYKGINDYIRYLDTYFSAPYRPLDTSSYSGVVFVKYLSEYCSGYDMIKKIWETHASGINSSIEAIDRAIKGISEEKDIGSEFSRFAAFNINPEQYYKEGHLWETKISIGNDFADYPVPVQSGVLDHLSSDYIFLKSSGDIANKPIKVIVSNESKGKYGFKLQKRKKIDQSYEMSQIKLDHAFSEAEITVRNFGKKYDQICIVSSNVEKGKDALTYHYSASIDE